MYYHIDGILAHKDASSAVIDCGGVGYKLSVSLTTAGTLPALGERVKLFAHLVVREDVMELLGFGSIAEKNAFLMLITVSGIGPKVAMSVLSSLTAERFAYAVVSADHKAIATAHGVSTKTAQKIILELKDKIAKENPAAADFAPSGASSARVSGAESTALDALVVLGYSRAQAADALAGADMSQPLETVIKAALKKLLR